MLLDTADITTGNPLTPMEVDPTRMPRAGEKVVTGSGVTWEVAEVIWRGRPTTLRPALMLSPIVDGDGNRLNVEPMDVSYRDAMARAAFVQMENR